MRTYTRQGVRTLYLSVHTVDKWELSPGVEHKGLEMLGLAAHRLAMACYLVGASPDEPAIDEYSCVQDNCHHATFQKSCPGAVIMAIPSGRALSVVAYLHARPTNRQITRAIQKAGKSY